MFINRTGKDGTQKEYYTLECLLFFLKNISLSHPVYVRQAAVRHIKILFISYIENSDYIIYRY